jgi:hypothetical protein
MHNWYGVEMSDNLTPWATAFLKITNSPALEKIPRIIWNDKVFTFFTKVQELSSCPCSEADGLLRTFPSIYG